MSEGEQETLSATVVPPGSPVTWYSSNKAYATVDNNGVVTAVSPGVAIIIASITVDGVTYDDDAMVTVEEKPLYSVIGSLIRADVWDDPDAWIVLEYLDTTRAAHIEANTSDEYIDLVSDPEGQTASLFADLRPRASAFEIDPEQRICIEFEIADGVEECEVAILNNGSSVYHTWTGEPNRYRLNDLDRSVSIPLICNDPLAERLITVQIKNLATASSWVAPLYISFVEGA